MIAADVGQLVDEPLAALFADLWISEIARPVNSQVRLAGAAREGDLPQVLPAPGVVVSLVVGVPQRAES
jgi:hypothetical protein